VTEFALPLKMKSGETTATLLFLLL